MDTRPGCGPEVALDCIRVALPIGTGHQIWTGSYVREVIKTVDRKQGTIGGY